MHRLPPSSTRPHTLCPSTTRFRSMSNAQQTHIPLIFSEPGLDIAGPVGLDDVRGLILAALGASPVSRGIGGPVFQYIGSLESPSSIGLAGPDGTYLTLALQREEVDVGDGAGSRLYAVLPQGDPPMARAPGLTLTGGPQSRRHP